MHALIRRWLIRGVCCAFLASLIAVCFIGTPSVSASGAFTDGDGRFSFTVPDGWQEDDPDGADIIVQYQIANPLATCYVMTMPLPENVSLDDFIPLAFEDFSNGFQDFHPSPQKDAALGGEPAKQIDITATASGHKVALSQIYAAHDGTVYILTIATPSPNINALKAAATAVTGSWTFL